MKQEKEQKEEIFCRDYLNEVSRQIRCKKAIPMLEKELQAHMEDQRDDYLAQGISEDEAQKLAIQQMGDPVETGKRLDKVHKPGMDWVLLAMVIGLSVFGIVIQRLIFPYMDNTHIAATYGNKTIWYNLIGLGIMIALLFLDYRILGKRPWLCYGLYLICTFLIVRIGQMGISAGTWISVNGGYATAFQAGNFCWMMFVPVFAVMVYRFRGQKGKGILKGLGILVLTNIFMMMLGTYSTAMWFMVQGTCLLVLIGACAKGIFGGRKHLQVKIGVMLLLTAPMTFFGTMVCLQNNQIGLAAYQIERLRAMLQPEKYGDSYAYPTMQARSTVANASFAGTGSLGTFQTRSGAYSDYIINCALSYFGIGVVLLLLVVLTLFLLRVFHISVRQKNQLGFLLGIASCSILVLKSLCYVGANFGVLPGSAVDMPLLSYGLNNTIANAVMIGLVLSVYRYTRVFDREPLDSGAGGNCGFTLLQNGKSRV